MGLTGLAASMVVNALVTGLILFKILKVFLEAKQLKSEATSVERTLGSLNSTGGPDLRHIIFIIIESGMALFAIQLVRVVITILAELLGLQMPPSLIIARNIAVIIHQILNVICSFSSSTCFVLLITFTCLLGHCTNNNFGAGLDEIVLR